MEWNLHSQSSCKKISTPFTLVRCSVEKAKRHGKLISAWIVQQSLQQCISICACAYEYKKRGDKKKAVEKFSSTLVVCVFFSSLHRWLVFIAYYTPFLLLVNSLPPKRSHYTLTHTLIQRPRNKYLRKFIDCVCRLNLSDKGEWDCCLASAVLFYI